MNFFDLSIPQLVDLAIATYGYNSLLKQLRSDALELKDDLSDIPIGAQYGKLADKLEELQQLINIIQQEEIKEREKIRAEKTKANCFRDSSPHPEVSQKLVKTRDVDLKPRLENVVDADQL